MMRKEITPEKANTTKNGNYVGPKPQTDLEYAQENWVGGYDEEGDYTGSGEYDANMTYVASPTRRNHGRKRKLEGRLPGRRRL